MGQTGSCCTDTFLELLFISKQSNFIIGVCILLRVILTVNYNTFCFATIDKVFYLVASVHVSALKLI
jgi:hypothetical protein